MKILLIHRYFWPDHPNCGQILWHLTQKLATQGHQVDVLTSLPSKDLNSKKIVSEKFQILTNIKIERMDLSIENNSPIKKIINALKLGFRTNFLVIKNKYDIIISTSIPPITGGLFAAIAASISKAKFIYFCMDLHPEVGRISKDFSNPILFSILQKIDNWSCSRANPVIVHSLDMKNSLLSRESNNKFDIEIINNFSIPTEEIKETTYKIEFNPNENDLNIIFAGNLGRFQSLDKVIDAMIYLKEKKNIKLVLVGDGAVKKELISKVHATKANVKFFDHQPANVVKKMISKVDIGLVSLSKNIYKYGYPGKIMTYLEQGKPIISVLEKESEIVKLMEQNNCGFNISDLDPKNISEFLIKLAENKFWNSKMSQNAKKTYEKYFSTKIILSKWSKILFNE
jgi:glycosyltransferase involved in cell wall biosynthesis